MGEEARRSIDFASLTRPLSPPLPPPPPPPPAHAVPFEEDEKDPKIWFLDHSYLEAMYAMFKKVNGERAGGGAEGERRTKKKKKGHPMRARALVCVGRGGARAPRGWGRDRLGTPPPGRRVSCTTSHAPWLAEGRRPPARSARPPAPGPLLTLSPLSSPPTSLLFSPFLSRPLPAQPGNASLAGTPPAPACAPPTPTSTTWSAPTWRGRARRRWP